MKNFIVLSVYSIALFYSNYTKSEEYRTHSEINFKYEAPLVSLGFVIWGTGEFFKDDLTDDKCRWCSKNTLDENVRNVLKWNTPEKAANFSNYALAGTLFTLSPVLFYDYKYGGKKFFKSWGESTFIVLEALSFSIGLNQLVKFGIQRERPYVRTLKEGEDTSDQRLSFYSGHTSSAFALVTASAMLYTEKNGKYVLPVWIAGGAIAVLTGYLRIAGDKHYFSDVLTGAIIGSLIGIGTIKLHKYTSENNEKNSTKTFYVLPSRSSMFVGFTFMF